MKIKELIKALEEYNPEREVLFNNGSDIQITDLDIAGSPVYLDSAPEEE
jgi:hypothetical protein